MSFFKETKSLSFPLAPAGRAPPRGPAPRASRLIFSRGSDEIRERKHDAARGGLSIQIKTWVRACIVLVLIIAQR